MDDIKTQKITNILKYRNEGKTLKEISLIIGLSKSRVRQLIINYTRKKKLLEQSDFFKLSTRVQNCLLSLIKTNNKSIKYPTRQQIEIWLASGDLDLCPNMGKKSIQEVFDWLNSSRKLN